jgi:hypothetical protein
MPTVLVSCFPLAEPVGDDVALRALVIALAATWGLTGCTQTGKTANKAMRADGVHFIAGRAVARRLLLYAKSGPAPACWAFVQIGPISPCEGKKGNDSAAVPAAGLRN